MARTTPLLGLALLLAVGCGPPAVRPTTYPDPEVPCPGGRTAWALEVLDRRADREGAAKMTAAIQDGIEKSFPGCRWLAAGPGQDTITIEVHRFASREDQGSWDAAAEWSVSVQNAAGRTLLDFQANQEVSRPNYRGSNNEKESLSEAFHRALQRTVKGLQTMSRTGARSSPREDAPQGSRLGLQDRGAILNEWTPEVCASAGPEPRRVGRLEWKSHSPTAEDI